MSRGLHHSEAILLSLIKKGLTRQEAYKLTQGVAMKCYEQGFDFRAELKKDPGIRQYLNDSEIEDITTNEHYFRYVDAIFNRVFDKSS
jgi:adenylosuccinate lyase